VYGLGALPTESEATRRIYEVKGRSSKPLPIACADTEAAKEIVDFNKKAEILANSFWPGPLTLILPTKIKYPFLKTLNVTTLGVRVPDHKVARELARSSGGVITSTSANKSGRKPSRTAKEAEDQLKVEVDLILDAGPTTLRQSSTIIDLSDNDSKIIRIGPINVTQIKAILGDC
jgi:L-threonylcarbamoyladenylate synthase